MTNFEKVGIFMKTFGQEVKTNASFSSDKINKLRRCKKLLNFKKFKYTITAKAGGRGLFSSSSTYKITKNDIGYQLADNLCYLTGVEGYTNNDFKNKLINN